jgi:CRISPR/Cas system-associated endonuclease Cas1
VGKGCEPGELAAVLYQVAKEEQPELCLEIEMVLRALRDAQQNIAELQETGMQEIRELLLSIEGRAAQRYWGIVRSLLYEQKRQALRFIIVKMNNIGLLLSYSEFTREVKSEHLPGWVA